MCLDFKTAGAHFQYTVQCCQPLIKETVYSSSSIACPIAKGICISYSNSQCGPTCGYLNLWIRITLTEKRYFGNIQGHTMFAKEFEKLKKKNIGELYLHRNKRTFSVHMKTTDSPTLWKASGGRV